MLTTELLEEQVASVMATLTKTAVTEICKVINSGFTEVIREVCLRQNELEALRTKVLSLTSEGRATASVKWCDLNDKVTPLRRSVAVQVSEQGEAECSTLMDVRSQDEAVVELIVKVEGGEEHGTLETNQNSGEDSVVGCSASGGCFPDLANRNYEECYFNAPSISPSQSDTSPTTHSEPDMANQLHALASPLRRHSSSLLPADFGPPVKEEESVDTPGVSFSDDRQFSCNVCDKSFKLRCHLQQHKLMHSVSKPFTCHYCGKHFSQFSIMKAHQRVHTREKPYLCPVGGETFSEHRNPTRNQIKQHQKLLNRNTTYKHRQRAAQPSSSLATDPPLLSSLLSLQEERTFQCMQCGKSFNRSTNLERHQRIHTGERPYECSICGRRFTQKTTLTDHQHTHTGERPYHCPVCGQTFNHHSSLTRHQKTVHQKTQNRKFGPQGPADRSSIFIFTGN